MAENIRFKLGDYHYELPEMVDGNVLVAQQPPFIIKIEGWSNGIPELGPISANLAVDENEHRTDGRINSQKLAEYYDLPLAIMLNKKG